MEFAHQEQKCSFPKWLEFFFKEMNMLVDKRSMFSFRNFSRIMSISEKFLLFPTVNVKQEGIYSYAVDVEGHKVRVLFSVVRGKFFLEVLS